MIVLTATTAERVHGQKRTGIIQSRMMIARIADRHIRTSQITKRPVIRHQRSWITVERDIFEVISPIRIATDQKHDLVGSHLLHKTTSLRTLSRIEETDTGILIRPEHAAGHLPDWNRRAGWKLLLNTRGLMWKKLSDAERADVDEAKALSLMTMYPALIKRPVLDTGAKLIVGFAPENYAAEFK